MRATTVCLLLLSLPLTVGCKDEKKANVVHEHVTPTRSELEVLEVHRLDPDSDTGQEKLRKMRERKAKLDAAEERMQKWADEAAKREAEEAQE